MVFWVDFSFKNMSVWVDHAYVAWTNVCMLISHVFQRGRIAAQHTADVQTASGILRETQTFYHIGSLQSPFHHTKAGAFQTVCLQPATHHPNRHPPLTTCLLAASVTNHLVREDATLFAAFQRQGRFAGLSANQCEHAIIQTSLSVGWGCGDQMSILQMFLPELLLIWNSLKWGGLHLLSG